MYPSSELCLAQQAFQIDRASGTTLENIRVIATKASAAWGKEAVAAAEREARGERVRRHRLLHLVSSRPLDADFSENPIGGSPVLDSIGRD